MTIRSFELLKPKSIEEATELLLKHGDEARPIAGGTTLVILMKQRALHYPFLVDLLEIPELNRIETTHEAIRIGATVSQRTAECSPLIRQSAPVLAEAYSKVGNIRVRQTASVGGNLAHADYRLDPPPALLVLGATLILSGPKGQRSVPVEDFYLGMYETILEPGEILTEIRVPPMPKGSQSAYLKFSALSANDWPCLGVAALIAKTDGLCRDLKVAVSGLATKPLRIRGLDFTTGKSLDDRLLDEVVALVDQQIEPMPDLRGSEWYKRKMAAVFVKRAVREAERRIQV